MKLVLHTLIIFFGTLLAAGLVALGEPVDEIARPSALPSQTASIAPQR
jgi:hypothetical protein